MQSVHCIECSYFVFEGFISGEPEYVSVPKMTETTNVSHDCLHQDFLQIEGRGKLFFVDDSRVENATMSAVSLVKACFFPGLNYQAPAK